jgi:hypothetical protein
MKSWYVRKTTAMVGWLPFIWAKGGGGVDDRQAGKL